jgi:hypothetical protein
MGQSVLVDREAESEQKVLTVLSDFVTSRSSEDALRASLARCWQSSDCSLLREALSIVAECDASDAGTDALRADLRALLRFRFSSDRNLESPAPRIEGVTHKGSGFLARPTYHIQL